MNPNLDTVQSLSKKSCAAVAVIFFPAFPLILVRCGGYYCLWSLSDLRPGPHGDLLHADYHTVVHLSVISHIIATNVNLRGQINSYVPLLLPAPAPAHFCILFEPQTAGTHDLHRL